MKEPSRRRHQAVFLAAAALTLLAGRWSYGLFTTAEFVHFSVNFPAAGNAPAMTATELGGPWAMDPELRDLPLPAGGMLVWGREGEITVDLARQGIIKRLLQPRDLTISSHWIRNVGNQPRRIRLDLDLCGWELEWETFERDWDPQTKSSTRVIPVKGAFNMDWHATVPPAGQRQRLVCGGSLQVFDADSGQLLTGLPVTIIDSDGSPAPPPGGS